MYGITDAVDDQIRQAQARHGNFVNGAPNHRDNNATDYFETILTGLEFEMARVRVAMETADAYVLRERHNVPSPW